MMKQRGQIYGQSTVVGWESRAFLEIHLRFNPPGCTQLPYEMSPMVSPSSLGNPAMFLLLASGEPLSSARASAIYSLDAANLPWAIQEEITHRILSPRHGEESMQVMKEQWSKLVERYSSGAPYHDVNDLHYFYARGILDSMDLQRHSTLLEEWHRTKRYARPLTVASTMFRLNAANLYSLNLENANVAPDEQDYGELLSRTMEIPIAHRAIERGGDLILAGDYMKKLWNFPLEVKRSIINQHELFGLEDIDSFAAMVQEYNEDWAASAWMPWGDSRLKNDMLELIENE